MRFLHTADWHVGKSLAGRGRADEYRAMLAELAEIARRERVDLTLVAGDVFDSAAPSPEAENVVYGGLLALSQVAPVIVVPGNHDNERRLAAIAPLAKLADVTIHPFVTPDSCVDFTTSLKERVKIALLPWLSQRYVVKADQIMTKEGADLAGDYRDRVRRIITTLTKDFSADTVNIFAGHLTIVGAALGGGERTAQTIFDYWVDATAFPSSAHYVALGHVHRKQKMPGPCPIHYCGSPLQLDFSDTDDNKHALVVEATATTPAKVTEIELTSGRRLRTLTGSMKDLQALAKTMDPETYLRVIVREKARVGLAEDVRELFPNAVKVIVEASLEETGQPHPETRRDKTPAELFTQYLSEKGIDDPALVRLFNELHEEAVAATTS